MGDVDIDAYNKEQARKAAQKKKDDADAAKEAKRQARVARLAEKKANQGKRARRGGGGDDDEEGGGGGGAALGPSGPAGPTLKERLAACFGALCIVCSLALEYSRYACKKFGPTVKWLIIEHPLKFWGGNLFVVSILMVTISWTQESIIIFLAIIFSLILVGGYGFASMSGDGKARGLNKMRDQPDHLVDVEEQIEKSMQEQMLDEELEQAEAKLAAAQNMLDDVEEGKGDEYDFTGKKAKKKEVAGSPAKGKKGKNGDLPKQKIYSRKSMATSWSDPGEEEKKKEEDQKGSIEAIRMRATGPSGPKVGGELTKADIDAIKRLRDMGVTVKEARDAYVMNNRNEAFATEELMERKHQYDKREKRREKKRLKKAAEREEDERISNMSITEKKNAVRMAAMGVPDPGSKKKKKADSGPRKPPKSASQEFKSEERGPPPPEVEAKASPPKAAGSVEKGKKSTGGTLQSRKNAAKPIAAPPPEPKSDEEDTIPRIGQKKLGEKKLSIAEDMHIPSFKPKAVAVESKPKPKGKPTSDPSRERHAGGRSSTEMHEDMRKGWSDSGSDSEGEIEAERLSRKDSMQATEDDATDLAALEAMLG